MTRARTIGGRSQRDELERLQEELRAVRRQREVLPRENAELAAQLARLEEEVRTLHQARAVAHAEWSKPAPSLPARLETPFCAMPSRRTPYGRMRFALRSVDQLTQPLLLFQLFFSPILFSGSRLRTALLVGAVVPWLLFRYAFFQEHEDDDERLAWNFDDEGFGPVAAADIWTVPSPEVPQVKVLYSEVREVAVRQGWLQRRFGFGSVRVTWKPREYSFGKAVSGSSGHWRVDIDLLDNPQRLAEWILARAEQAREEKTGGARVG